MSKLPKGIYQPNLFLFAKYYSMLDFNYIHFTMNYGNNSLPSDDIKDFSPDYSMEDEEGDTLRMCREAVSLLLHTTEHTIYSLSEIIDIDPEKLLYFNKLSGDEIEKLELLRFVLEN